MAKVISIIAKKGGCGKSETAMDLSYGLGCQGKKVLLCDADPQGNTTGIVLGIDQEMNEESVNEFHDLYRSFLTEKEDAFMAAYKALQKVVEKGHIIHDMHDVLENNCTIKEAIQKTRFSNVDIVPASSQLLMTDLALKSSMNPSNRLRRAIQEIEDSYDYVIIDNQPFENSLTYNAMAACYKEGDLIIIPTKINRGGLEGTYGTLTTALEWLQVEQLGYDVRILITMTNRNRVDQKWTQALQEAFGEYVFQTTIRYQAKPVQEASLKREILLERSKSGVADDYRKLVEEILQMS